MWGRLLTRAGTGAGVLLAGVVCLSLLLSRPVAQPARAQTYDQCAATGSPLGPFDMQSYDAADYQTTYPHTMELAGANQLFPDLPSFALPPLETGDRSAGSGQTVYPVIPPVIIKAIAWLESGWAQAAYSVPYGMAGPALVSPDCGYGIMQVTSGMQNVTGIPNLDQAMIGGHFAFNIARGARILADKWNLAPEFRPLVGNRDPNIIEDWYFALWSYNGFAFKNHPLNPAYSATRPPFSCGPADDGLGHDRSQYPYQEMIFGCIAHPPSRNGVLLWDPQDVHLPDLTDPRFSGPLSVDNWNACVYQAECAAMDIPSPVPTPAPTPTSVTSPTNTSSQSASPAPSASGQALTSTPVAAPASTLSRAQVIGYPTLTLSQSQIALQVAPPAQSGTGTVAISNTGTGVLAWHATSSTPWLRLSRYQGIALGSDLGATTSGLTISVDPSGLTPGEHTAQLTVESLYAAGAPTTISVDVAVSLQQGKWLTGDFNGDGRTDLIQICCSNYAYIWMAQADGSFSITPFQPSPDYGMQLGSWQVGDFNGDGKADLIHLCCQNYANVWLSRGDGTFSGIPFQPSPDYGMQSGSWLSGDFNGDGKADLLHLCCQNYANVWLSRGDGTFSGIPFQPSPDYGMQSGSWQIGDFNGDGKSDLLHICCPNYANVWTSLGNGAFSGTPFQPAPDYGMQSGSWLSGDFNGDKKSDLLHLCCPNYVNEWLSQGNGNFVVVPRP